MICSHRITPLCNYLQQVLQARYLQEAVRRIGLLIGPFLRPSPFAAQKVLHDAAMLHSRVLELSCAIFHKAPEACRSEAVLACGLCAVQPLCYN